MKTHWRKVHKSDHLGSADLEEMQEEGKRLVFTIKHVKQEVNTTVAGRKGDFNVAYFIEDIKPLVLNATNSKALIKLYKLSGFVEDWVNLRIEVYVQSGVKDPSGGKTTGVRIRSIIPKEEVKAKPVFTEENFEKACKAKADTKKVLSIYQASEEMLIKYTDFCNGN